MPEVLVLVGPLAAAATALATPRLILTCRPPPRLHSARQNGDLPPHGKTAARPCASLAPKGPELCTPMGCEFPPTARASMSHSTFRKKTATAGQALPLWWAVSGARSERLSNGKPAQIRSCKRHAESRWVWNLTILGKDMAKFCELRYLPVLPCDVFGRNSHIQTKKSKAKKWSLMTHGWSGLPKVSEFFVKRCQEFRDQPSIFNWAHDKVRGNLQPPWRPRWLAIFVHSTSSKLLKSFAEGWSGTQNTKQSQ